MKYLQQTPILFSLLFCLSSFTPATDTVPRMLSDSAEISLLTATPGHELYSTFGHTAIRVYDPAIPVDMVFNYGLFSFEEEHFYYKFVRGETWYELGMEPIWAFMEEYTREKRPVSEQVLNLTQDQKEQIMANLLTNLRPENRKYLYNFVYNNCATKPYDLIKHALGDSIISPYTSLDGITYRQLIRLYTGSGSWIGYAINLIFGLRADQNIHPEQTVFLPDQLQKFLRQATLPDGTKVVQRQQLHSFSAPHTPWYADYRFGLAIAWLLVVVITLLGRRYRFSTRWMDIVFISIFGLLTLLILFLRFFSIHPLVGFGLDYLILLFTYTCTRYVVLHIRTR